MKNEKLTFSLVHFLGTIILVVFITTQFTSCGGDAPEEETTTEQVSAEQQRADSLAQVKADSIAAANAKKMEQEENEKKQNKKTVQTDEDGYYTVSEGETLASIAEQLYGDSKEWYRLFAANEGRIDYYDRIYPGTKLKLPETEK